MGLFAAYALVAGLVERPAAALSTAGANAPSVVAFVIDDEEGFAARQPEYAALGLETRRIDPVFADATGYCPQVADLTPVSKAVGIAAAHFHTWDELAALGQRALVLEADYI